MESGVVRVQAAAMINSNTQTSMTVVNSGLNEIVQSVKLSKTVNMNATNIVVNVQVLTFYMAVCSTATHQYQQSISNSRSSSIYADDYTDTVIVGYGLSCFD